MKKYLTIIGAVLITGCASTNLQTNAFKTISAVDQGAKAMYGGYIVASAQGLVATNDIPKITNIYRQIETDCTLAALTSEAGTNALSTANLQSELSALAAAIAAVQPLTSNK